MNVDIRCNTLVISKHLIANEEHSKSYYEVPKRRIMSLIGREDITALIDNALTAGSVAHSTVGTTGSGPVLQGMGGQGKSQVALHYCHQKKNNPFSAVFWVDAMTESSLKGSFQSISECIRTTKDHLLDVNARIAFVLRRISSWSSKWLMVFDNYDNPDAFPIQDFIPQGDAGAILVTSRHAVTSALVLEHSSSFIELPGLEENHALELLPPKSDGSLKHCHRGWESHRPKIRTSPPGHHSSCIIATMLIGSMIVKSFYEGEHDYKLPLSIKQNLITHTIAQSDNYEEYLASMSTIDSDYLSVQPWLIHFLSTMGSYENALIMGERAIKRSRKKLGLDNIRSMDVMHAMLTLHVNQK